MTDARCGQPAANNPPHSVPAPASVLAALRQRAMPAADHLEPKQLKRGAVHKDTAVSIVPLHHGAQPLTHFRDVVVDAALEFDP